MVELMPYVYMCACVPVTLAAGMQPVTISKTTPMTNKLMNQPTPNKFPFVQNTVCNVQQCTWQHRPALRHLLLSERETVLMFRFKRSCLTVHKFCLITL